MDNSFTFSVPQLQAEVMSLIESWADRGVSPQESAMILAGISHSILARMGMPLSQMELLLKQAWETFHGKI